MNEPTPLHRVRREARVRGVEEPLRTEQETVSVSDEQVLKDSFTEQATAPCCGRVVQANEQAVAVCGVTMTELLCEVCGSDLFRCSRPECQIHLCPSHRVYFRERLYCPAHAREERLGWAVFGAIVLVGILAACSWLIAVFAQ